MKNGNFETIASFDFVSQLNKVDFPTFVLPTIAIVGMYNFIDLILFKKKVKSSKQISKIFEKLHNDIRLQEITIITQKEC
ncbi:hypothetical protein AOQ87_01155 [Candidatus Riesia pediculischaeffi]|uniref:Uncharacterized protein n=1 Tax=Candidatus Riesia pediculischaeffi TaxID=428411 RepID=A0A1V0HKC2_9ENTR|nr:hypothetical protein AOQ87_01155 [Candidatus Riesia pediculischaeffi]